MSQTEEHRQTGGAAAPLSPAADGTPAPALAEAAAPASAEAAAPAQAEAAAPRKGREKSSLRETVETVAVALVIALLIRSFLVQLYVVDGESMYPTLHDGDRLLVNKLVYRMRAPQPGEIVVLEDPHNPGRQLVKRVIAVAGETIEVRNRVVFVNGQPLHEEFTNPFSVQFANVEPTTVPEGHVYVMGDNRGASLDSRALGPIETAKVEGRAFFLFWPFNRINQHGPLSASRTVIE